MRDGSSIEGRLTRVRAGLGIIVFGALVSGVAAGAAAMEEMSIGAAISIGSIAAAAVALAGWFVLRAAMRLSREDLLEASALASEEMAKRAATSLRVAGWGTVVVGIWSWVVEAARGQVLPGVAIGLSLLLLGAYCVFLGTRTRKRRQGPEE